MDMTRIEHTPCDLKSVKPIINCNGVWLPLSVEKVIVTGRGIAFGHPIDEGTYWKVNFERAFGELADATLETVRKMVKLRKDPSKSMEHKAYSIQVQKNVAKLANMFGHKQNFQEHEALYSPVITNEIQLQNKLWAVMNSETTFIDANGEAIELNWYTLNELCESKEEALARADNWKYAHDHLNVIKVNLAATIGLAESAN